MERTYRAKVDGLTQRERTAAEKLQQAQEVCVTVRSLITQTE